MTSKIICLVLLGATLAAAAVPAAYEQMDSQNLQKYFMAKDLVTATFMRDWNLGRVMYIIEEAKQKALGMANKSQVEEVAWQWTEVQHAFLNIEWEIRYTIEAMRQRGQNQATQVWAGLTQRSINLLEQFKRAAKVLNSVEMKKILVVHRNDVRQTYRTIMGN